MICQKLLMAARNAGWAFAAVLTLPISASAVDVLVIEHASSATKSATSANIERARRHRSGKAKNPTDTTKNTQASNAEKTSSTAKDAHAANADNTAVLIVPGDEQSEGVASSYLRPGALKAQDMARDAAAYSSSSNAGGSPSAGRYATDDNKIILINSDIANNAKLMRSKAQKYLDGEDKVVIVKCESINDFGSVGDSATASKNAKVSGKNNSTVQICK